MTEKERQHLRLTILKLLNEDGDHSINEGLLEDLVDPYGFSPSRAQLKAELRWLEALGCVVIEDLDGYLVASLTDTGIEVATGRLVLDGIAKPRRRG